MFDREFAIKLNEIILWNWGDCYSDNIQQMTTLIIRYICVLKLTEGCFIHYNFKFNFPIYEFESKFVANIFVFIQTLITCSFKLKL